MTATVWLRLTENGTDADLADDGDHEYDDKSRTVCQACGFEGKLHEFAPPEPDRAVLYAGQTLDVLRQAVAALNTARSFTVPSLSSPSKRVTSYDLSLRHRLRRERQQQMRLRTRPLNILGH